MKIFLLSSLTFILLFSCSVFSQTTRPTPVQTDEDEVVKISTSLVQVDAIVTDRKGNSVTDLTAKDFEILQDGKPQAISSFSYVNMESGKRTQIVVNKKNDKNLPLPPPVAVRSTESRRVLTFVVDDGNCDVTIGGMKAAREGLEKFVKEQMQPNDLVAIYLTHPGSSLLQQYTSDKARLLEVTRKIRGNPIGSCYTPITNNGQQPGESIINESKRDRENREAVDNFSNDRNTGRFTFIMRYVLNGLRNIGGRKVLFLFSDGLYLSNGGDKFLNSFQNTRDITELANRRSVVINTIDVRRLIAPDIQMSKSGNGDVTSLTDTTVFTKDFLGRFTGLDYLARETGGEFYKNTNFLDYPIHEGLKSERGYYLIGYQPDEETFKGKKFHKIEIKMVRPELVTKSRSGFSGITDQEIIPKPRTGDSELYEAIVSPISSAGLDVRATTFFVNTATEGSFVRTLLYLDGKQLTFTDEPNAMKKAVFDVIAVTLNENNEVVDEFNRTHTLKFPAANLTEMQQNGLIYSADIPVKQTGAYNFRVAVRDASSRLIGSAGQQIDIPDLKKGKIYLSGLIIGEVAIKDGKPIMPSIEKVDNGFAVVPAVSVPAIRRFHPGAILGYSYKIYNVQPDKISQQPKLTVQTLLYRDGQLVLDGKPQLAQLEPQSDLTRIGDYGYLKLPPAIQPGDYSVQVIIKDLQSNSVTSQWIDFEVVK